jgi:release factor glutamine methyltransferase
VIVRDVLKRSASWLAGKGVDSARLEAELLLAHLLNTRRIELYASADRPLDEAEKQAYRELLKRRVDGEPVAYLTGYKEFYGLEFQVTADVLVPRPETELLVDRAREIGGRTLLDLGTGSGCIAIACAVRMKETAVTATEISPEALSVAKKNAELHAVADRIRFREGDLFGALPEGARFDLIVCNPPYVPESQELGDHEPTIALYAGRDGMTVLRRLLAEAEDYLAEGGTLLAEIGEDQADPVRALAQGRFARVQVHEDLAGHPRVLEAG